jgi:hypothetical protein
MDKIAAQLVKKWSNPKDIEAGVELMHWLDCFDRQFFQNFPEVQFSTVQWVFTVRYFRPIAGVGEESYTIYLYKLAETIEMAAANRTLVGLDGTTMKYPKNLWASRKEVMISIAGHEVRHRLQQMAFLKKITAQDEECTADPLLKQTIGFVKNRFKEKERIYQERGESAWFIKKRLDDEEFDATVVEYLIGSLLYRGANLKQIAAVIQIQS